MAARPLASQHVAGAEQHACARAAARCGLLGRIGGGCWEAGYPVRFGLGRFSPGSRPSHRITSGSRPLDLVLDRFSAPACG